MFVINLILNLKVGTKSTLTNALFIFELTTVLITVEAALKVIVSGACEREVLVRVLKSDLFLHFTVNHDLIRQIGSVFRLPKSSKGRRLRRKTFIVVNPDCTLRKGSYLNCRQNQASVNFSFYLVSVKYAPLLRSEVPMIEVESSRQPY